MKVYVQVNGYDAGEALGKANVQALDQMGVTDEWYEWASKPENQDRLIKEAQEQDRIGAINRQEGAKSSRGEH